MPGKILNAIITRYSLFVFIVMGCYACSQPELPKQQKRSNLTKVVVAKAQSLPEKTDIVVRADYNIDIFGNNDLLTGKTTVYTFNRCKLLAQPDSAAPVLKSLAAFVPLTFLNPIRLRYPDTIYHHGSANDSTTDFTPSYYEVKLGKQKGYIAAANLAECSITDKAGNALYLFGHDYQAANYNRSFIIKKVNLTSRQLLTTAYRSVIPDAVLDVLLIKGNLLPGVNSMVKIVGHADFCGGGKTIAYLLDVGHKLVALPDAFQAFDDSGAIYNEWVFLPKPSDAGQYSLKTDTLGDRGSSSLKTFTDLPAQPSAEQIIVYTCLEGQFAMDKSNQPISLKNGHAKLDGAPTLTTRYYKWTGQKLVQLPGTKKVKLTNRQFEAY